MLLASYGGGKRRGLVTRARPSLCFLENVGDRDKVPARPGGHARAPIRLNQAVLVTNLKITERYSLAVAVSLGPFQQVT